MDKPPNNDEPGVLGILMHPINLLLLCLPVGLAAFFCNWSDNSIFWWNFAAMIPLAKILGDATEELAASLQNDMIAGILNATFGNAVEMIITIQTLRKGLFEVVKATLLGSVLSNTLLVLGMSFLCGGFITYKESQEKTVTSPDGSQTRYEKAEQDSRPDNRVLASLEDRLRKSASYAANAASVAPYNAETEKVQAFNILGALVNTSMLLSSCTSFCLITAFYNVLNESDLEPEEQASLLLRVSRGSSIIIALAYVAFIIFQLVTHRRTMSEDQPEESEGADDAESSLSVYKAVALLFVTTLLTAFCSELLVRAIDGVTRKAHLNQHFIGMIILPIVGNACEHAAAVRFAMHDKLGLSVSISIGSSTQIALFVVPFAVLMAWAMGKDLDLNFGFFNTSMITLSVIVVLSMIVDGHSNWLQGYLLCSIYAIIGVLYFYLPDSVSTDPGS